MQDIENRYNKSLSYEKKLERLNNLFFRGSEGNAEVLVQKKLIEFLHGMFTVIKNSKIDGDYFINIINDYKQGDKFSLISSAHQVDLIEQFILRADEINKLTLQKSLKPNRSNTANKSRFVRFYFDFNK